ncbi:MAG: hypothetical protein IK081_04285 [Lachnospiraceae bacterium]|nr:hypothetical protein [Lachnospiraceae bacterium]
MIDYVEIKTGQSGAAVYDLDGQKILKHVVRKKLKAGLFDTYCREALFYQCKMQEGASYLPEILDLEISEDEILILICDWQGVGIGGASGDISFFLSRLGADGITIDEKRFLELYSDEVKARTGITADVDEIARHMAAANVITSFSFWHEFLHGNEETRVRGIYDKMVQDFEGNRV